MAEIQIRDVSKRNGEATVALHDSHRPAPLRLTTRAS
jgi:hypothetical protein